MKVKVHYDKETTKKIEEFEKVLKVYMKKLKPIIEKKTKSWTNSRDIEDAFWDDTGLRKIEHQIEKIKKLSIPVSIEIID